MHIAHYSLTSKPMQVSSIHSANTCFSFRNQWKPIFKLPLQFVRPVTAKVGIFKENNTIKQFFTKL